MGHRRVPLTLEDREDISRGLAKGLENKDIAFAIGRDESVVSQEIARHGGREAYRAWKADAAARESRERPKERKIDTDPELRRRVVSDLMKGWSPEEIAGKLCYERSRGETDMSVSHEAIYTWIYAQPKGELADLPAHLRKSLTWDQGTEMARHAALTLDANLPVYFAHAHSRGSVAPTRTPAGSSGNASRKGQR